MNILALDTATPSTAVALARADGWLREARDDVAAGERPRHAQAAARARRRAARRRRDRLGGDRRASRSASAPAATPGCGSGSRRRTRHRAGARRAAWSASGRCARSPSRCATAARRAVIDARRGEAFVAVYRDGAGAARAARVRAGGARRAVRGAAAATSLAVGDGALRFRSFLEAGGIAVAPERERRCTGSARRPSAGSPRAGTSRRPVPDYLRLADAERALSATTR